MSKQETHKHPAYQTNNIKAQLSAFKVNTPQKKRNSKSYTQKMSCLSMFRSNRNTYFCSYFRCILKNPPSAVNDVIVQCFVYLLSTTFSPMKNIHICIFKKRFSWKVSRGPKTKCLEIGLGLHFGSKELAALKKRSHTVR